MVEETGFVLLLAKPLMQDFFSAHGEDALLVAHQIYKTTNVIKYLGRPTQSSASAASSSSSTNARGLPSVTISRNLTTEFLRDCLVAKQMRVEIYVPEDGVAGRKNNSKWVLSASASPGNIGPVEDLLFHDRDMTANAVSMAIKVIVKDGQRLVGCAFVDVQEKEIGVAEFAEDEIYSNTEVGAELL
jgi:DNA mismatch repair protein MSH2